MSNVSDVDIEAELILKDARKYKQSHRECTYHDYENYKRRLYNIGAYGYERKLAKILGV